MDMLDRLGLIEQVAAVPSFSSYEERLHPLIESLVAQVESARIIHVADNNLIVEVPGTRSGPSVALAAHLDKINHFSQDRITLIPVRRESGKLIGLLDDAAGVGICLSLLLASRRDDFLPLLLLFSEMEESTGLRHAPHLLKNNGAGLYSGIGAERIARSLIAAHRPPAVVITVDTTPLFQGAPGVALYSDYWEIDQLPFTEDMVRATRRLQDTIQEIHPPITFANNTNDYITYGTVLNEASDHPIPSLAIEPAIYPYHQAEEGIFVEDIETVAKTLRQFLRSYGRKDDVST